MPSNGLLIQPDGAQMGDAEALYRQLMQIAGRDLGLSDWGSAVNHTSYDDDAAYAHVITNQGTGGHLNVPNEIQVKSDGTGTFIRALTISGSLVVTGTVTASRFISTVATGTAPVTVASTTKVTNLNADLLDGLDESVFFRVAGGTITGNVTMQGTLAVDGNVTLGNASTDTVSIQGDLDVDHDVVIGSGVAGSFLVGTQTLWADPQNNRVGIGTNSPSASHVLDVNGNVNFQDTVEVGDDLTVGGDATFGNASGDAHAFNGTVDFNQNVHMVQGLQVDQSAFIDGNLDVDGSIDVASDGSVFNGTVDFNDQVTFDAITTFTNNPQVVGTDLNLSTAYIDFDLGSGSGFTEDTWSGHIQAKHDGAVIYIPYLSSSP